MSFGFMFLCFVSSFQFPLGRHREIYKDYVFVKIKEVVPFEIPFFSKSES